MPVEIASQVDIAYQYEMWIGPVPGGSGATVADWTQVFGFETLNFPTKVPEDIDVTHMQSPGRSRETIPGLLPVGEFSQEMQYWETDPGQMLLTELADLNESGTREDVLVELVIGATRRTYRSNISAFTAGGTVGAKAMATLDAKLFERVANSRVVTP